MLHGSEPVEGCGAGAGVGHVGDEVTQPKGEGSSGDGSDEGHGSFPDAFTIAAGDGSPLPPNG